MTKKKSLSEVVIQKGAIKRKFSLRELYRSFVFAPKAIAILIGNRKRKLVDDRLIERLHLAVTEVNGCAVCSYQHTKMALQQGMSGEEIASFLSGGTDYIKPEEAKAIMFAQHFADSRGFPKIETYDAIVEEYGKKEARIILAACQVILSGNIFGIPFSAFLSRLHGKPYKNSSLFYELWMIMVGGLLLPIAHIHGLLRIIFGLPNARFDRKREKRE